MAIRLAQDRRARRLNNSASPLHTHRSGTPFLINETQKYGFLYHCFYIGFRIYRLNSDYRSFFQLWNELLGHHFEPIHDLWIIIYDRLTCRKSTVNFKAFLISVEMYVVVEKQLDVTYKISLKTNLSKTFVQSRCPWRIWSIKLTTENQN